MNYYYSVIQVKEQIVLLQDPEGDLQVVTKDFFDYEVQENDLVYLKEHVFHFAQEETKRVKEENHDKLQQLFNASEEK